MAKVKVEAVVTYKIPLVIEVDENTGWQEYQTKSYEALETFKKEQGLSELEPKVQFKADRKTWQKQNQE